MYHYQQATHTLNLEEPPLGYEKLSVAPENLAISLTRMPVKANYGREFYVPNSCPVGVRLRPPSHFTCHKQPPDWLNKAAHIFLWIEVEGLICFCLWGLIYCLKVFGCLLGICEKGLQKLHVFHLQFRNRGTVLRLRLTKAEKLHWSKIRKLLPRLWTKTKNPLTQPKTPASIYVCIVCMHVFF